MSPAGEAAFEAHIAEWLVEHGGYRRVKTTIEGYESDFDGNAGVDTADLFEFIGATQAGRWDQLVDSGYGGDPVKARASFVQRLSSQLDKRGTVDVLRRGVVDRNVTIQLAFFRPASGLTPELVERYEGERVVGDPAASVRAVEQQDHRSRFVRERHPGGDSRVEEPFDRSERGARDVAVPQRSRSEEPGPQADGDGAFRGRSLLGVHDHPSSGETHPVPAVQPGPRSRIRQPAQP